MAKIKRLEGRIGEPQEFVEFQTKDIDYVAQEAGGVWYVFRVQRKGMDGVRTLYGPLPKTAAIAAAETAANAGE
jgi:hypothetical protein